MRDALDDFLDRASAEPYRLGVFDCCLCCSNWIEQLTGTDLMEPYRHSIYDYRRAMTTFRSEGGLARMLDGSEVVVPVAAQRRGDIGHVWAGQYLAGAIAIDEKNWAAKLEDDGLLIWSGRPAAVFRVA